MENTRKIEDFIAVLPGEMWLPFPLNPDLYFASSLGRVFSFASRHKYHYNPKGLLKTTPNNLGYHMTALQFDNAYAKPIKIHQIIALTFHKKPDFKCEVHHIDHNKSNNRADNLRWVTHKENILLSFTEGGRKIPEGLGHWNYGRLVSSRTRKKMSVKKLGEKHPKFKGYYSVDGVRYPSACQAGKALDIPAITVTRRCKNPRFPSWEFIPQN